MNEMTRSIRVDSKWSDITLLDGWGDLNDGQIDLLANEVVSRFESETGLTWVPQTSELIAPADAEVDVEDLNEKRRKIMEDVFNAQDDILAAAKLQCHQTAPGGIRAERNERNEHETSQGFL